MNRYVVNTKNYNSYDGVTKVTRPMLSDKPHSHFDYCERPSCFYEMPPYTNVHIGGYDPDLRGPESLIKAMRDACDKL